MKAGWNRFTWVPVRGCGREVYRRLVAPAETDMDTPAVFAHKGPRRVWGAFGGRHREEVSLKDWPERPFPSGEWGKAGSTGAEHELPYWTTSLFWTSIWSGPFGFSCVAWATCRQM